MFRVYEKRPVASNNCRQRIKSLRPMGEYRETCCANLPDHLQLIKLCSNAGLASTVEKGQYLTTLDDTALDKLKGSCRQYTLPQSDKSSQVKGWILGPVLDVAVSYHQGRYGVEVTLFVDGTRSWVSIVNGINKYVTEMSEETHIEDIAESTGRPVAKARPKQTSRSQPLQRLHFRTRRGSG